MIRRCGEADFEAIWTIINDGAGVYQGIIPEDCWHSPYMGRAELQAQLAQGVEFYGYEAGGELAGVMGLQPVQDVTLIRHAYVRSSRQRSGIGAQLLAQLTGLAGTPVLIGTWAAAFWAIRFYEKNGFTLVSEHQKDRLLRRYWGVPERQIETSVVLADQAWMERQPGVALRG
ncbi:GNAT family N-acetyltransferase [Paludibaculum fermentans]|uniref:GNAT family N-acetyltransferase n=1 Tax=Paludibaculum fermentans TaxID=1473598 RepID=A0A7S7NRW4_PALFE|nr:GNAT family N-acetyltransferase [Paludibaculum fermentans]QOY88700.1 GNAT family N-acetyltransferase [Paludibaculum fermentans]